MSVQLKEYQDMAVGELSEGLRALLDNPASDKICVFKAPTGSGKTVMAAKFIERFILENSDRDVCFIWLSVASGDLDGQSKDSLKGILEGAPHVGLVEEEFTGGRRIIERSEIVVASWQKLFLRNRQTLEWKNVLMKDGENVNFREVLTATRAKRKIILIVDESHIGKNAPRTNELREVISADVEIEMSATPLTVISNEALHRGTGKFVMVESADVIKAGVIKKEIIINEGLSAVSDEEADSQTMVLEAAYAKRIALQTMFGVEGSSVKPLVLVQVPNAAEGEAKIEAVKVFLAGKGITEANGRLAVWLSEEKSDHLDTVKDKDSLIEFLIFKQAVATGWDCPRAHILVRFREIEGYVFEMQTVGRILRMPELRHYDTEALNRGYIFTNLRGITVDSREETSRIIKSLSAQRQASWTALDVPTYFRKRFDYKDITAGFDPVFEKVFCKELCLDSEEFFEKNRKILENKGLMVDIKTLRDDIISDGVVTVLGIDEAQCDIPGAEVAHFSLAPNDVANMFDRIIRRHLGPFKSFKRSIPKVRATIYVWCIRYLGMQDGADDAALIQRVFLHPKNKYLWSLLEQAIEAYVPIREKEIRRKGESSEMVTAFEAPVETFFSGETHEEVAMQQYLYVPCYLEKTRSIPERSFEEFLNTDAVAQKVSWWWKNGDNGQDNFGIKYSDSFGDVRTFYPDYLVWFNDGRLGIFETKDANDPQGLTDTKCKAEALQKFITEQNGKGKKIWGGIVVSRISDLFLNQKQVFDWVRCQSGDWGEWDRLRIQES